MASISINTFSFYSHSKIQHPKFRTHTTLKQSPSITSTHLPNSLISFNSKLQSTKNIHSHLFTHSTKSPNLQDPFSRNTNPFTPLKEISKFFKKTLIALVGSFIFLGFVNTRPVLAKKVGHSEYLEQERETHEGEIEDEEMYLRLLEENPRNVEALDMVARSKIQRGKTKAALDYAVRLLDIEIKEPDFSELVILCYQTMWQRREAKKLCKEILKETPLSLKTLHDLARVMHSNSEGPSVFETMNEALDIARREERDREENDIEMLIKQMHIVKGELEDSLEELQDLIDENPRDFRPYLCQGVIYSLLDEEEEAESQFEMYRSLVPEEFPHRGFLDDVVLAAKAQSMEQLEQYFKDEFSNK